MTPEDMLKEIQHKGRPLSSFKKGEPIEVNDKMQKGYTYTLQETPGTNFAPDFQPFYSPGQMLRLGVFEGKYLNDCIGEFPAEWFLDAIALDKLRPQGADISINLFNIKSRLPLSQWRKSGWVPSKGAKSSQHEELSNASLNHDPRGWFQWYCRYWMGRRIPELDTVQIKRWKAFTRHQGAVKKNCTSGDVTCRPRQRQALLQWSYNPFI
jgi:hypothetical protein